MDTLTGFFQSLNEFLDTPEGQAMLAQLGETVSSLIEDLVNVSPEDIVNGLTTVVENIRSGLEWVQRNKGTVIDAITAIIAAWAGLKVAQGVTTLLNLVNSIKGLTAAEAAAAGASTGSSWAGAFATAAMKAAPFLAFLYTLLNPASGSDAVGNNDLIDENGNLTNEAKEYGFGMDESGELILPDENAQKSGRKYTDAQEKAIQGAWDKYRTGQLTKKDLDDLGGVILNDAKFNDLMTAMYEMTKDTPSWRDLEDLPDDFFLDKSIGADTGNSEMAEAAKGMKGLPGMVAAAVTNALNGTQVVINGEQLTHVVGVVQASDILANFSVP